MSKVIDLTNRRFGRWTVISRAQNNSRGESMWNCLCDCGNTKVVQGYALRKGKSLSCGCLQKEIASKNAFEDLSGQQFGRLTVIKYLGSDKNKKSLWECECNCNAKTHIQARTSDLKAGKIFSCGCIKSLGEAKIAQLLSENNIPFEKEKTFETCKFPETGGLARFDFYVNNSYLIEYDGVQHFKPTFNQLSSNNFNITKIHDEYKNKWCLENKIPLIRIPYTKLQTLTIEDLLL